MRIFGGTLRYEKDVEAVLHAQTIYGNFTDPVLQGLRSFYEQKLEEYRKKLDESEAFVTVARQLEDSSKVDSSKVCISISLNGHLPNTIRRRYRNVPTR